MINGKKVIAVCTSRIYDGQHRSFLEQLNEYLLGLGHRMFIFTLNCDLYWREETNVPESYVFDIITYDKIECLILMDEKIKSRVVAERMIAKAKKSGVPVIVVDGRYDDTTEISFDYESGFENVVRHVIEHHSARRPHFIAGIKGNKFSEARLGIFKKVITENGIKFDDSMVSYGEFWAAPAREAAQRLIDKGDIPDAVICANDIMAINVCDVFLKAGIGVPEKVIVTGFDGIEETLRSTPCISTAGCDSTELAEAVGKCAAELMNGETPKKTVVMPKLTPNASCGCEYIPTASSTALNSVNNTFYRYQDDVRALHDISTSMQQALTPECASEFLASTFTHDMCCIVNTGCFESGRNFFVETGSGSDMCIFYDSYGRNACMTPFAAEELVPDIESKLESGYPLIFNALDHMSKPFGYICYSYKCYDITDYAKTASITNTVSIGLGGYVNMRYQSYLTEKMTTELKVAAQIQLNMLPTDFRPHRNYEINASMIPAKNVGGDFYDFFHIDSKHLGLIIADVSGKGVPAALFMSASKLMLHERALMNGTPAEILYDVNERICENNKMGLFITIWFGILDLDTGMITYANAGHEYPAVKSGSGRFEYVMSENFPPVGAAEDMTYEDLTIDMSKGGCLFLYTDGVTDVKNENGEHFGLDRTLELLNSVAGGSPEAIIKGVNNGLDNFCGNAERFDDTTMMCIKFINQQ